MPMAGQEKNDLWVEKYGGRLAVLARSRALCGGVYGTIEIN
jgi:hypothetical protein